MAAPDVKAIAAALATSYASLTPPTGYPAIRRATDQRPNEIPTFPLVTVDLPDISDIIVGGAGVDCQLNFRVRCWFGKHTGDQARDDALFLSWGGVLLMASVTSGTLGQGANNVKSALGAEMRYFVDDYASTTDVFGWEIDQPILIRNWPLT